jgi:hypothetical protein
MMVNKLFSILMLAIVVAASIVAYTEVTFDWSTCERTGAVRDRHTPPMSVPMFTGKLIIMQQTPAREWKEELYVCNGNERWKEIQE